MNPFFQLFRMLATLRAFQSEISDEAEKFDKSHNIQSPMARKMAWVAMAFKVLVTASIMGDFPLDLLPDLTGFGAKLGWFGVLIVGSSVVAFLLLLIGQSEAEENRVKAFVRVREDERRKQHQ